MKKNNIPKQPPIDSLECSKKSVIGLYEMLAQAQPDLTDKDVTTRNHGILNLTTPSRSDE